MRYSPVHDVVRQPLPVGISIGEPLSPRSQVLCLRTRKAAIVLCDSGPFLESIDVGYPAHGEHPAGSLI